MNQELIPIESMAESNFQAIAFMNKTIDCLMIESVPYVVVNSVIEAIGLAEHAAKRCIRNDEVLTNGVLIWAPPALEYKGQSVLCLQLELLPIWLVLVSINKVKPEVKETLLAFRKDAYKVISNHFFGKPNGTSVLLQQKYENDLLIEEKECQIKVLQKEIVELRKENSILTKNINETLPKVKLTIGEKIPLEARKFIDLVNKGYTNKKIVESLGLKNEMSASRLKKKYLSLYSNLFSDYK